MGYYDGLTDASFKTDSQGRHVFYPWGSMGSGYILESQAEYERVRGFIKKMYMTMLPIIIVLGIVGGWRSLAILPVYFVWWHFARKKLTAGLAISDEKLKYGESLNNSARSHNLSTLIVLFIASLVFVISGALLGSKDHTLYFGAFFFGLCSIAIGKQILIKLKKNKA